MITLREYARRSPSFGLSSDLHHRLDWFVIRVARTRDSNVLEECNWKSACKSLGEAVGEKEDLWEIVRFSHWACGWVEHILVAPDSLAREEAQVIEAALEDYPILDDESYSEMVSEAAHEVWKWMPISDRIETCKRFGVCMLRARSTYVPNHPNHNELECYLAGEM